MQRRSSRGQIRQQGSNRLITLKIMADKEKDHEKSSREG